MYFCTRIQGEVLIELLENKPKKNPKKDLQEPDKDSIFATRKTTEFSRFWELKK